MSRPAYSIRYTLQSTSLLAVVAGYMVLIAANYVLSNVQRIQAHQQQVALLQQGLSNLPADTGLIDEHLERLWLPGFVVRRINGTFPTKDVTPVMRAINGEQWLESGFSIPLRSGKAAWFVVAQNVTASIQHEWFSQMLLIVAACCSSLITSALLRPVLQRGLARPLKQLSRQLDDTQAPPAGSSHLNVEQHPKELQTIALSFNQLQDRLASSWQRERAFVDGVAHELRTPITLISGYAQTLLRQDLEPEVRQAGFQIDVEAKRMASLVVAFLALARQDAGRLQLELSPISPQEQLLLAYERLKPACDGRLILGDIDPIRDDLLVHADEERLQQCIAALVENACLYSKAPGSKTAVSVELFLSTHEGVVIFHVLDRGPGVPDSEKSLIFERFVRGHASENVRGSGIGLSVVKELMLLMAGSVDVVDVIGGGADFRLHLPMASGFMP